MTDRITRLQDAMRARGLDAVAVACGANLFYLAGLDFHTKLRLTLALFPAEGQPALVLPQMEAARAGAAARLPLRLYPWGDAEGPAGAIAQAASDLGLEGGRIGVEHTVMRVFELRALEEAAPGCRVEDATPVLAGMRMVKDTEELAAMRQAVRVIEEALRAALAQAKAGITERELADLWERGIRAAGCGASFATTVASGPNGANPHHASGDRRLQVGDLVVLDGGAVYDGYASDITRTVAVGQVSDEARRVYELVLRANEAGRAAAAQPGATGESIDAAARGVIEAGGYGQQFIHRTGHGLGIDVHEPPFIVAGSREPLPAGATFTVEPGVYLQGRLGVRIEDDIVLTSDGAESLTTFPRELTVIC
jgi:Xaa-Pro aminopeptidase